METAKQAPQAPRPHADLLHRACGHTVAAHNWISQCSGCLAEFNAGKRAAADVCRCYRDHVVEQEIDALFIAVVTAGYVLAGRPAAIQARDTAARECLSFVEPAEPAVRRPLLPLGF